VKAARAWPSRSLGLSFACGLSVFASISTSFGAAHNRR
jgi:hypothetical protein